MNDLPLEIWDIIVKQNNETIFDKANELSLKELYDATLTIQCIYERKRSDYRQKMKKHIGDIVKIKYMGQDNQLPPVYPNKIKEKEDLFLIDKCSDDSIKVVFVYKLEQNDNIYNETTLGFYTMIEPEKEYSCAMNISYKNIIDYEVISYKKDIDEKRINIKYDIGDVVSFYLYSYCYFWGIDLEVGKIERISDKFYYITMWGETPRLFRVPKHHIVRKNNIE